MNSVVSNERWVHGALVVAVIAISFAALFFRAAAPTHPLVQAYATSPVCCFLSPFLFNHRAQFRRTRAFSRSD